VELLVAAPLETPAVLTVARIGGAGLLALGVACWLARADTRSRAARGLVAAVLLYDVAAAAVLAFAGIGFGLQGVGLWPAMVLHAVMTVWCLTYLLRSPLNMTMDGNLRKQSNTEKGPQRQRWLPLAGRLKTNFKNALPERTAMLKRPCSPRLWQAGNFVFLNSTISELR
jgi:hypothetical protein